MSSSLIWPSISLLLLWKIWDAGNARIFKGETRNASGMIKSIIDELSIWLYYFKHRDQKEAATSWRGHLSHCKSILKMKFR
jgi:hypothetical protein